MGTKISLSRYVHSIRFYLLFVSILFIGAIVLGYVGFLSDIFSVQMDGIQELSENIKDFTQSYPSWLIFLAFFIVIFLNNAFTCFLNILLGPLLGIFPMFSTVINGGLLGWFAQEMGFLIVFLGISLHGIFEIPAFLLSAAIGLKLGREVFKRKGERHLKNEFNDGLWVFLHLVLPLLLIAALIESALITIGLLLTT